MYIATQQSLSDIIQENLVNGKLSFSAAARLMEVHHSTIIKDGGFVSKKLAETLELKGFTACGVQNEGFCAKSFWLTIEYFAYDSKAKANGAKQLARTFGQIGVMTAFDKLTENPNSPQLTPFELTQQKANTATQIYALPDGYLKELLRDELVAVLSLESQKQLTTKQAQFTTVKVRARELGYSTEQIGTGGQLGRYTKKHIEPAFSERVGKYDTWHYELNERFDEVIHSYFR